ncbi:MAG: hypothetical protein HKN24_14630 [Acidimicrobiales bacterium]|nr:hypothetical protein [Acidimicrobiales bacterium]
MERLSRQVILAGSVAVLIGMAIVWSEAVFDTDPFGLLLGLLLVGMAGWHFFRFGLGRVLAVGILAFLGLMLTMFDFGDGTPIWSQGYSGAQLVGSWMVIASAGVVLIGVLASFVSVVWLGEELTEDVTASLEWWRRGWIVVVGVVVAFWVVGYLSSDTEPSLVEDDGNGAAMEDGWSISVFVDDEGGTAHNVTMIETFTGLDEADVEEVGGRLVWLETEFELCDVAIQATGEGFVQVGNVFPGEECEPDFVRAIEDFGLPESGCLFVRSAEGDDEHCAPLAVE